LCWRRVSTGVGLSVSGAALLAGSISIVYRFRFLSTAAGEEMPADAWRDQLNSLMGVGRVCISIDFLPGSYGERCGQSAGKVIP
jgi:hypothetical protein